MCWNAQLEPTMKSASFEIYQNISPSERLTVRYQVQANFVRIGKSFDGCRDIWTMATAIDFRLAETAQRGGETSVISCPYTADTLELGLRRLRSQVCYERTGDQKGADRISGLNPLGSGMDSDPTWLIKDAKAGH